MRTGATHHHARGGLSIYRSKRDFAKTSEPSGKVGRTKGALGYWKRGKFIYAGRAGTGFSRDRGQELRRKLNRLKVDKSPFAAMPTGTKRGVHFVAPQLVAEVEFATWTADGLVRQGSFITLRDDKPAKSIGREHVVSAQGQEWQ
jgi:bifunctional non-homologous end joining protein LigD